MVDVAKKRKKSGQAKPEPEKVEPKSVPAPAPGKWPTELIRCPGEIAEMLHTIEQHKLNGWNTIPKILDDEDCPLKDWLRPLYELVLKEKAERAARMG